MKATLGKERIAVLDALRGWALLGILLVNATFYSTPLQAILWQTKSWSGWNRAVEIAVSVLVEGKFLAIFAFLFGYGAVFLTLALYVRNRMLPAAAILGWEWINFLLPPTLKKVSVIHYLHSLCPLPLKDGPFAMPTEPTPAPIAVGGLLALIAVLLALAMRRARKLEVSYGAE